MTGVVTFLVGFIGLPAAGVNSPASSVETATATITATTTATVTATASAPSDASDAPASGSPAVRWSGSLLVSGDFDLDAIPPRAVLPTDGDIALYQISAGQEAELTSVRASLAVVPAGENPDSAKCALLSQTQGQRNATLPLTAGGKLCLITNEGRSALVTVTTVHPQARNASLDVIIWQKTD
ncbi:hypothetical protein [Streptomyces sp. NPDC101776]|uniref:hypothetical protein n=1 Tax=Streptomyces sp. NPDC101776 TaxID=3366146 RepID=UPI0038086B28